MKFRFVLGFILLILFFIGAFVGLPYLLQIIKSNQGFSFPQLFSAPTSTAPGYPWYPGYFYKPTNSTSQPIKTVDIAGVSRYGSGQISLRASSFAGTINITGWRIKSAQKGEFVIGKGIKLPQFDVISSDIQLAGGESAEIITDVSPMASNFRINSCFGGLNSLYNFGYSFNSCPRINYGDLTGLDSSCQDLIMRSVSCLAPSDDILNKQSSKCRIWFEKNVNYSSCVVNHQNDRDFYKGWMIYTGNRYRFFDQLHDRIELRDQAGLLVDSYEY